MRRHFHPGRFWYFPESEIYMAVTYLPIWKDKSVALGSADYADYEVRLNSSSGEAVFSGRAYKRPGAAGPVARINDICWQYMSPNIPASSLLNGISKPYVNLLARTFSVVYYTGGAWVEAEAVTFYADWSYDYDYTIPANSKLTDPVRLVLDQRQALIQSVLEDIADENKIHTVMTDGTTGVATLIGTAGPGGYVVNLADTDHLGVLRSVQVGTGPTFAVEQGCGPRWALHYINAYGGWDSILLTGKALRTDALTRHTLITGYDNAVRTNRGTFDYAVEYDADWEMHTDWLTEDEASRMHHVLNTPFGWLQDLGPVVTGSYPPIVLQPVVLTNTDTPYKTRRTEGGVLIQYTINLRIAQQFVRR